MLTDHQRDTIVCRKNRHYQKKCCCTWRLAVCPDSLLPSLPVATPLKPRDSPAPTGDQPEHAITIPDATLGDHDGDRSPGPVPPSRPTHPPSPASLGPCCMPAVTVSIKVLKSWGGRKKKKNNPTEQVMGHSYEGIIVANVLSTCNCRFCMRTLKSQYIWSRKYFFYCLRVHKSVLQVHKSSAVHHNFMHFTILLQSLQCSWCKTHLHTRVS